MSEIFQIWHRLQSREIWGSIGQHCENVYNGLKSCNQKLLRIYPHNLSITQSGAINWWESNSLLNTVWFSKLCSSKVYLILWFHFLCSSIEDLPEMFQLCLIDAAASTDDHHQRPC